jgi:threonine synthase
MSGKFYPPFMHRSSYPNDHGVIARWRSFLPVTDATPVISLNEGSTPLIYSPRLSARVGRDCQVFVKYEGLNPTCSFKDRGMTVAISKAVEEGARAVICASTGNTSAAAAAYASRAGIECIVLLPVGKIALGKLVQAIAHGSRVVQVEGNFDDALRLVREIGADPASGVAIVNSINPYRIEGQKTASFEIIDELGDAPDVHILPVGNAGNITAYWRGYREFRALGRSQRLPRMTGFQAAGAAPIFYNRVIENPETLASAIRIGNPASWAMATAAVQESGGAVDIVTDEEILLAQAWLAANEGIFVEPASAASIAGLLKHTGEGRPQNPLAPLRDLPEGARIVCTVTGHGLKDVDTALKNGAPLAAPVKAERGAIMRLIER